ncbi:MAG TPA: transporter substrate-binding domain-containing protein [Candidatus Marinimicrobia bacterium]|nr:transporter substrate-binding domain-containing protein [Candidatus Neomarinimicrobiota bacterium]
MNKKILSVLLLPLLLLAGEAYSGEDFDSIRSKGGLRVAVYKDFPPYSYSDKGRIVGIDVDIAKAIASELEIDALIWSVGADENMEDDLRNFVWKGHYLGGGTADFMMHVPFDKEFAEENDKVIIFSPYATESVVVLRDAGRAENETVMQTFLKGKVGVELDTMPDFYLTSSSRGMFRNSVKHFMTVEEAVAAFLKGDVQSVVAPKAQIESALGADRSSYTFSALSVSGRVRSDWKLAIAIKEGRDELIAAVKAAFGNLQRSGKVEEIYAKYNISYESP